MSTQSTKHEIISNYFTIIQQYTRSLAWHLLFSPQSSVFKRLNDDTLGLILKFVGKRSCYAYGAIKKRCRDIQHMIYIAKETFLYGYVTLSVTRGKYNKDVTRSVAKSVVLYNRRALLMKHQNILRSTCSLALEKGRKDG